MYGGLEGLLGERILQFNVVQQGIELILDLEIGGLTLRLFLDQLHLDVAEILQFFVFLSLSGFDE